MPPLFVRSVIRRPSRTRITSVISRTNDNEIPRLPPSATANTFLIRDFHKTSTTKQEPRQSTDQVEENPYAHFKEQPRVNPVGIQYLSRHLDKQIFPSKYQANATPAPETSSNEELIELSRKYLDSHKLLGKKTNISEPLSFDLPKLQGGNLDEHFRRLALFSSQGYLENAKKLADVELPEMPKFFEMKAGWWRYGSEDEAPEAVTYPEDDALIFDVETQYKVSSYPVMAIAASEKYWYAWVSPILTLESKSYEHLIPLNTLKHGKVIVGHNVGYDRARVKEEYSLKDTKAFYLDTMSLHIAVSGMCSQQRLKWLHHRKLKQDEESSEEDLLEAECNDPWVNYSSPNSLKEVAQFYVKEVIDKDTRNIFAELDLDVIRENFQELIKYCANDVLTTHKIYRKVLPEFLDKCPHPVSFAALRHMSSGILPTDQTWYGYITTSEQMYQEGRVKIEKKLNELANEAVELRLHLEEVEKDPWLSQLDWTITPQKFKKDGTPYKNQKLPGFPEWYRELYSTKEGKLPITIRSRLTPLLLRLTWENHPVIWHDHYGWCFKAPFEDLSRLKSLNYIDLPYFEKTYKLTKVEFENMKKDGELRELSKTDEARFFQEDLTNQPVYFRIPNSIGPDHRTTLLMAKEFSTPFEKQILKSDNPLAQEAIKLNASCSYWISARERITSQFVVDHKSKPYSLIVPQILQMGTVTRRAVEKTWLTASNAKKSRIGSELKSKIKAPPGYCFVGADVDSEELWIASLVGDAQFQLHGGTAIGWMTLEGSKSEGTDLHSKTASILGISRNEAKIFNYGRIYGAGVKFASTLLKKFNPGLSVEDCKARAVKLYAETKGSAGYYRVDKQRKKLWYGGSESVLFNELERIAHEPEPKTPILGASITKALNMQNLNMNSFLTSRVNWAIQSSGVDYLHLLCVSMNYLIQKFNIDARLSISVHDEIRYLVKFEDRYKASRALQISNLWTRAIFSENLGMKDLPQSCAFFSAVDVDSVLRKEVDMDCITPSNPVAIPPGESLDINKLLSLEDSQFKGYGKSLDVSKIPLLNSNTGKAYEHPVEEVGKYDLSNPEFKKAMLKMQICGEESEFKQSWRTYNRSSGGGRRFQSLGLEDIERLNHEFSSSSPVSGKRGRPKIVDDVNYQTNIDDSNVSSVDIASIVPDSEPKPFRKSKSMKEVKEDILLNDMALAMSDIMNFNSNTTMKSKSTTAETKSELKKSPTAKKAQKEAEILAELRDSGTMPDQSKEAWVNKTKKILKNFKDPLAKATAPKKSKSVNVEYKLIEDEAPTETPKKSALSDLELKQEEDQMKLEFLQSLMGKDGTLKKAKPNPKMNDFPPVDDFNHADFDVTSSKVLPPQATSSYTGTQSKYQKTIARAVQKAHTVNARFPSGYSFAERSFHRAQGKKFLKRVIDV